MANMFKPSNWKEELYKDDVINVSLNGALTGILGGILAGAIDYLFDLINVPITFGLVILAYLVGWRMRKGYYSFHVLYPVLSIVFLTLGLLFSFLMQNLMFYNFNFQLLFSNLGLLFFDFFIMPFAYPFISIAAGDILYFFMYMINIICYALAYFLCYKMTEGRN